MNTNLSLHLVFVIAIFFLTACGSSAPPNPVDRFSGTWSGTMEYSADPNAKQVVVVKIPTGCAIGEACGEVESRTCTWEMVLNDVDEIVFRYKFSKVLGGGNSCETGVGTSGTFSLQPDGKLMREHHFELSVMSGALTKE